MEIRFSGKFSDAAMSSLATILVQKGFDYVEKWFESQGVQPETGNFNPHQQFDKPVNLIREKNKVFIWLHIDKNKNIYLCYVLNPSDQRWTQIDFKTGANLYLN